MTRFLYKTFLPLFFLNVSLFCEVPQEPFYYFVPAKNWQVINPESLSKRVKISFVSYEKKTFPPSVNLAIEKIEVSETEYINIVKNLHLADHSNEWRGLGFIETKNGKAHLAQIDSKNRLGPLRMLQSILIHDGYAFIMTAVSSRKDFLKIQGEFLKMFRSLCITKDLFSSIDDPEKIALLTQKMQSLKESCRKALSQRDINEVDKSIALKELFAEKTFYKKNLLPFEGFLDKHHNKEGIYWQLKVMKTLQNELLTP
ncbi:MAG: hypothetical protein KAR79_06190 [Simkaniaceae bacterium]|nr:hypothetical protein [Simkaniaceae bacterium]